MKVMAENSRKARRKKQTNNRVLIIIVAVLVLLLGGGIIAINTLFNEGVSIPVESEQIPSLDEEEVVDPPADDMNDMDDMDDMESQIEEMPEATGQTPKEVVESESTMLPIVFRAKNVGQKIALTVDDCFQTDNMRRIMDIADQYDFKLTFFPVGKAVVQNPGLFMEVYQRGHQIENHSYNHKNMDKLSDDEMISEITRQSDVVNKALGLKYEMRIFRPPTGAGMRMERLHKVLKDLNYQALASWAVSGTQNPDKLLDELRGGDIILFHADGKSLERIEYFVPRAIEQGYEFVTINELYNKEPNSTALLEQD